MTDKFTIHSETTVGYVTLGVSDLAMMRDYYQSIIGLQLIDQSRDSATLGVGEKVIVRLEQRPGRQHKGHAGLFHLAILLPTRADLGQWLKHYISKMNRMVGGAGDHLVSEALYLDDPEANGIEMYQDRPRESWEYENGKLKMATLAVDLPDLVAQARTEPFASLPAGTTLGHVHLQVDDVGAAEAFYRDDIGLGHSTNYPGATFLGAGGYHHHIGANVWRSRGQSQPPAGSLGLVNYSLCLPDEPARQALLDHLDNRDVAVVMGAGEPELADPAGNRFRLTVG